MPNPTTYDVIYYPFHNSQYSQALLLLYLHMRRNTRQSNPPDLQHSSAAGTVRYPRSANYRLAPDAHLFYLFQGTTNGQALVLPPVIPLSLLLLLHLKALTFMTSGRGHPASGTLSSPSRSKGCSPPPSAPGSAISACPSTMQGTDVRPRGTSYSSVPPLGGMLYLQTPIYAISGCIDVGTACASTVVPVYPRDTESTMTYCALL